MIVVILYFRMSYFINLSGEWAYTSRLLASLDCIKAPMHTSCLFCLVRRIYTWCHNTVEFIIPQPIFYQITKQNPVMIFNSLSSSGAIPLIVISTVMLIAVAALGIFSSSRDHDIHHRFTEDIVQTLSPSSKIAGREEGVRAMNKLPEKKSTYPSHTCSYK